MSRLGEQWFPVSEWLERNIAMLNRCPETRRSHYLDAVARVRGEDVAQRLLAAFDAQEGREYAGFKPSSKYPFPEMAVGERRIIPGPVATIRASAHVWGRRHNWRFSCQAVDGGVLAMRLE